MAFLGIGETASKDSLYYWVPRLAKAEADLWNRNLDRAGKQYARILKDLEAEKPKKIQDELVMIQAEARLGVWAARYLGHPGTPPDYVRILKELPGAHELWMFVAKVLGLAWDTSLDALEVYKQVLRLFPRDKTVESVARLLMKAPVNPDTVQVLEQVARMVPDDAGVTSWYIRWAMKAGQFNQVEQFARETLARQPDMPDPHRCLGILAEKSKFWEEAARHYQLSQDWMRVAVCQNYAGNPWAALQALEKVSQNQRSSPTWLYHAGWAASQTGNQDIGIGCWRELQKQDPVYLVRLSPQIIVVQRRRFYDYLETNILFDKPLPEGLPEDYMAEAYLRQGAFQLLVRRRLPQAETALQKAMTLLPMTLLARVYLETCLAARLDSLAYDRTVYDSIKKVFGDASLFMLARSLWLAPIKPSLAQSYLGKAVQKGVARHLPEEALEVLERIIARSIEATVINGAGDLPFINLRTQPPPQELVPFLYAAGPAAAVDILAQKPEMALPWVEEPPKQGALVAQVNWKPIQAIYYTLQGNWLQALETARGELDGNFEQQAIDQGIIQSAKLQQWHLVVKLLTRKIDSDPRNPVYKELISRLPGAILREAWQAEDYPRVVQMLDQELKIDPDSSLVHHNLAVACTRWAVKQEMSEDKTGIKDLWTRAIRNWILVLGDSDYWVKWRIERSRAYGDEAKWLHGDTPPVDDLIYKQLPDLLRLYFTQKESQVSPEGAGRFKEYRAILEENLTDLLANRTAQHKKGTTGRLKRGIPNYQLENDHPYEILGLSMDADQRTITQAFSRENRSTVRDAGKVRQAYDSLRVIEERMLVDAMMPILPDDQEAMLAVVKFAESKDQEVDWLAYLDRKKIDRECLLALTEATVRHFFRKTSPPPGTLELLPEYDGLDKFTDEWLAEGRDKG